MKINMNQSLEKSLYYIAILLVSFDIALSFSVAGFVVRAYQLLLLPAILFFVLRVVKNQVIVMPAAGRWLTIWAVLNTVFIYNSISIADGVSYNFWLIFNALVIFGMVNYFREEDRIRQLLTFYIKSFYYLSWLGLFQWVLGICGIDFFVAQWWIPGRLPRINGFSYEPSYFAIYLLIGWTIYMYLYEINDHFINQRQMKRMLAVTTLTLTLVSSRLGWIMMISWILFRAFIPNVRDLFARAKIKKARTTALIVLCLLLSAAAVEIIHHYMFNLGFLLAGTGLKDTANYSTMARINGWQKVWQTFMASPFAGRSLGGVVPAVAKMQNIMIEPGLSAAKQAAGGGVLFELMVANGLIGVWFPILYFVRLSWKLWKRAAAAPDSQGGVMRAFVWSLLMSFIALQSKTNILRPYFWMHLAILSVVFQWFQKERQENGR